MKVVCAQNFICFLYIFAFVALGNDRLKVKWVFWSTFIFHVSLYCSYDGLKVLKIVFPFFQTQAPKTDGPRQKRKFSTYFKSLVIELDRELYGPDNHLVEVSSALNNGNWTEWSPIRSVTYKSLTKCAVI